MSLLQNNDTLPDQNLVQVILTAVFFNVLSTIVVILDGLFIFSRIWTKEFKTRVHSYFSRRKLLEPLKVPHHMAIAFGGDDYVDLTIICDCIWYAAENGVRQLSFYDTTGTIERSVVDLESAWFRLAKRTQFTHRVYFETGESYKGGNRVTSTGMQVCVLSRRHAKGALVGVCTELSQLPDQITVERVRCQLEMQGVYEVDFLVTVGCANTLHGYPPWSLRVAEIYALARLTTRDRLCGDEFRSMLAVYAQRDRRLGY